MDDQGNKRRRIRSFNAKKEEVLFEELASADILTNFADKTKKDTPPVELKTKIVGRILSVVRI